MFEKAKARAFRVDDSNASEPIGPFNEIQDGYAQLITVADGRIKVHSLTAATAQAITEKTEIADEPLEP